MSSAPIRIGTRRSDLALAQTQLVIAALKQRDPAAEFEIVPIVTTGDKKQGTPDAAFGDKKDWIAEIESALQSGEIDFAVHSAKDVPVDTADGTNLLPVLGRDKPFDVLITRPGGARLLADLPSGSTIGTASLRRVAQLKQLRRDIAVKPLRGNVPTRVRRLEQDSELAAIVLAEAGVSRLGLPVARSQFVPSQLVPAVNQGILAVQFMASAAKTQRLLEPLVDPDLRAVFEAERACVATLGADCKSALGVYAELKQGELHLLVRVLRPDGSQKLEDRRTAPRQDAVALGAAAAAELLEQGAAELLSA